MFNILTLNKIAKCGLDQLNDNYKITDDANVDAACGRQRCEFCGGA